MSKKNISKTIGKVILVIVIIITVVCFAVTKYVGGQDTVLSKYFSSISSGDLKSNCKAIGVDRDISSDDKDSFKEITRLYFTLTDEFAELEDNDIISCKIDVTARKMISPTLWVCTVTVDYYSSDMYITKKDIDIAVQYENGWICEDILQLNIY